MVHADEVPADSQSGQPTEFARRLRVALAYDNISTRDFAISVGVSANAISKYQLGKMYPSSSVLVMMARRLNVSVDWLMCGEPLRLECPNGNSLCRFNVVKNSKPLGRSV